MQKCLHGALPGQRAMEGHLTLLMRQPVWLRLLLHRLAWPPWLACDAWRYGHDPCWHRHGCDPCRGHGYRLCVPDDVFYDHVFCGEQCHDHDQRPRRPHGGVPCHAWRLLLEQRRKQMPKPKLWPMRSGRWPGWRPVQMRWRSRRVSWIFQTKNSFGDGLFHRVSPDFAAKTAIHRVNYCLLRLKNTGFGTWAGIFP